MNYKLFCCILMFFMILFASFFLYNCVCSKPTMGKHNFFRLGAVAISFAFFVISLVFNVLSVFGAGKFSPIFYKSLTLSNFVAKIYIYFSLKVPIWPQLPMCLLCSTRCSHHQDGHSPSGESFTSGWQQWMSTSLRGSSESLDHILCLILEYVLDDHTFM